MSRIAFDGELARAAAGRLDTLADGLDAALHRRRDALGPAAAALDPVSRQTAQTIGAVGGSFQESYASGVGELRKIAANLRAHADLAVVADDDVVDSFKPLM
ncbi:PE domain-containing protein [Nocardia brasiliensis]|uniref:PE domain-containing protein n=1 Tax=Nocardia brasiliensis TaxID=37326 RepID=A0A6G9XMX6_NOCBR|nr:PE domain-containing protein [Nocardia brasiliensis]QIS02302.1 PE domain-containing protein [Nocardia brasiliensis]